jgi:hypothetical protein
VCVFHTTVVRVVTSRCSDRLGVGCGVNYLCEDGIDEIGRDLTCVAVVKYEYG